MDAADVWNQEIGRVVIDFITPFDTSKDDMSTSATLSTTNSRNVIYGLSEWISDNNLEQAKTFIYHQNAQIFESDIVLNLSKRVNGQSFHSFSVGGLSTEHVDLKSLFVHEFGHVLGLGHVQDSTIDSVMVEVLQQGQEGRRELTEFDINSLACEY